MKISLDIECASDIPRTIFIRTGPSEDEDDEEEFVYSPMGFSPPIVDDERYEDDEPEDEEARGQRCRCTHGAPS